MKMAKVRNYSRHDVIIIDGKRYDKKEWVEIGDDILNEELTIIEKQAKKKQGKKSMDETRGETWQPEEL